MLFRSGGGALDAGIVDLQRRVQERLSGPLAQGDIDVGRDGTTLGTSENASAA